MSELLIYLKIEQKGVSFHLENSYISQSSAQQGGEMILNSNLKERERYQSATIIYRLLQVGIYFVFSQSE